MHQPPAVIYPVGRSRLQSGLFAAALGSGAAILLAWCMQSDQMGLRHGIAGIVWLWAAGMALQSWVRSPTGQLAWDTQGWAWTCGQQVRQVQVSVVLDSQTALLLQLSTPGQWPLWIWPERRAWPMRWLALRRAVFAPQPPVLNAQPGQSA